jgi:diguanylate cyclase
MVAFSTEELQTVLLQLDQAIYNHEQWSKGLDRTLICKSHCDQRDVSPDAHRQCQFGQWYYTYASARLQQLPAFVAIEAEHERMHQLAARLLMAVAAGKAISPYEYDNFSQTLERLRLQLHTLKRELGEQLYNRDPLTGANTRIGLLTELREQHELVKRRVQPCGLVMMDLDHFKAVNDGHGHPAGDQVLVETAAFLMAHLRTYDKVFRYGGEEFLICLPSMGVAVSMGVVERLREDLAQKEFSLADGTALQITASFGVAELDANLPVEATLDRADKALYAAKEAGRNCSRVWDPAM